MIVMRIPFAAWLLQGIPETIGAVALIMAMGTRQLPWKTILQIGLIQAVSAYLIRLLPFTPGVHVIVITSTMAVLVYWLGKLGIKKAVIFSAIVCVIITIFEFLFFNLVSVLGIVTFSDILEDVTKRIIFTYPQVIGLFLLAFLFGRGKKTENGDMDWE